MNSSAFGRPSTYAIALGLILVGLMATTFRDYGITYDENVRITYGRSVIEWYTSGFTSKAAFGSYLMSHQGGFSSVIAALAGSVIGLDAFSAAHVAIAGFALVTLAATYILGVLLAGEAAGLVAMLLVGLTPRFYGDMFNNVADMSFAATTTVFLVLLVRALPSLHRLSWRATLGLGLVLGLSLAIRITALIWFAFLLLACLLSLASTLRLEAPFRPRAAWLTPYAWTMLRIGVVAYLVMLPWWPAAMVSPIVEPLRGLRFAAKTLPGYNHFQVFYDGRRVLATALPWHYVPNWFVIALPEFLLLAIAVAGVVAALTLASEIRTRGWFATGTALLQEQGRSRYVLLSAFVLFPFVVEMVTGAMHYDGLRHYMFLLPPLAVLSAAGLQAFEQQWASRWLAWLVRGALAASMILTITDMRALHPYQYVYFNRVFGGGLQEASRRFEADYWGASLREGAEWLNRYVTEQPTGPGARRPTAASCLEGKSTSQFLDANAVEYVGTFDDGPQIPKGLIPDYFLATPRWGCDARFPGRVIHRVERMGTTLSTVIEVDRALAQRTRGADEPGAAPAAGAIR